LNARLTGERSSKNGGTTQAKSQSVQIKTAMTSIKKPSVYRVALIQACILAILCAALALVGKTEAFSAFLGGLLCLIPQAYFTVYAWQHTGSRSSQLVARGFYRGEVGKFVLTLVGFAIVFSRVETLEPLILFGVYGLMLVVQWVVNASLIRAHQQGSNQS